MDRDALAARIDAYAHRYNDIDADILNIITDAREALGQDLRSQHNMVREEVVLTTGFGLLPTDFQEMYSLQRTDGKRLQYITADYASEWREESGEPRFYSIGLSGTTMGLNSLEVFPKATESVWAEFYASPAELTSGTTTTSVLDALPLVYIYKCLHLVAVWAADWETATQMDGLYQREVSNANRAWKLARRTTDAVVQSTHPFVSSPAKGV